MSCYDNFDNPDEPHHIPGYTGHVPTIKSRSGGSFSKMTHEVMTDPMVPQSPIPILQANMIKMSPMMSMGSSNCRARNPIGCQDIGCYDPVYCPAPPCNQKRKKPACPEFSCCATGGMMNERQDRERSAFAPPEQDNRPQNRGPYANPANAQGFQQEIYRCCEGLSPSYAGHIPGFTFHSTGRTNEVSTFGTKQYMQNCWYKNTFLK